MLEFEWNESKRKRVLAERSIDFHDAARILLSQRVVAPSNRGGEQRWIAIGAIEGVEIAVVYTMRGDVCRIITARRARKNEREIYRARFGAGS